MAEDGSKRSDGGIFAPPNPLSSAAKDAGQEMVRISPEDCYDPKDSIYNSNLLHWETVLLGDEIKAAAARTEVKPPVAQTLNISVTKPPVAQTLNISITKPPEAQPLNISVKKPPEGNAEAAEKKPEAKAEKSRTIQQEKPQPIWQEKTPAIQKEKPAAKAAGVDVGKSAVASAKTAKIALETAAKPMPKAKPDVAAADRAEEKVSVSSMQGVPVVASKANVDVPRRDEQKKAGGLFGRLFGGARKAASDVDAASATAKTVPTTSATERTSAPAATTSATGRAAPTTERRASATAETMSATGRAAPTTERRAFATTETMSATGRGTLTTERRASATAETMSTTGRAAPTAERRASATTETMSATGRRASATTAATPATGRTTTTTPTGRTAPITERRASATAAATPATGRTPVSTANTSTAKRTPIQKEQAVANAEKTVPSNPMAGVAKPRKKPVEKEENRPRSQSNAVYRYFHFTGVQLMRSMRASRRRIAEIVGGEYQRLTEGIARRRRSIRATRHVRKMEFHAPFADLREKYRKFSDDLANAKQYGSMGATLRVFVKMSGFMFRGVWRVLSTIMNYAAPIAACILVALYVSREAAVSVALKVEYNGVELGYIADESVFTKAANDMKSRMILGDVYVADPTKEDGNTTTYSEKRNAEELAKTKSLVTPRYTLMTVDPGEVLTVDELTNNLIRAAGKSEGNPDGFAIEQADGLYIDDDYIGAVTDGQGLLDTMSGMLDTYVTDADTESGPVKVQFVKKVQVKRGLYPSNSIRPLGEIQDLLGQEASGTRVYTVTEGDTPLRIAAKNGISFDDLKALNPDVETNLQPNDTLLIAKSAPYLGVKISKTIKYEENVKYSIIQKIDKNRAVGYAATAQRGSEGVNEITAEVVMIDGVEVERNILDTRVVKKPVDQIVLIGGTRRVTVIPSDSSGQVRPGAFAWPAPVHNIGTGFMGYYGHTGADIVWPGCTGSPIFASADGVVVAAGWGGAYGNRVTIDHGGGVQTLYAHCSALYVRVGQPVLQGEPIAAIGRTGNVTGPHLHFEIRIGGTPVNPARYLY